MKFSQMQYIRPDLDETIAKYKTLYDGIKAAQTAETFFAAYKAFNDYTVSVESMFTLASIRKSMNTQDAFYSAEIEYLEEIEPVMEEMAQKINQTLLDSSFRKEMEEAWGPLMFVNLEMGQKTFSPDVVEDLQEENELYGEWGDLMAEAVIFFEGKERNLLELSAYFESMDREVRKAATVAYSDWFTERSDQFDQIFDAMVKVRTRIAKKLGCASFVELGYDRMQRSYDPDKVAKLRNGIRKYFQPISARLNVDQAKRMGVKSLSVIDGSLAYPDGNPKPKGTPDDIFAHSKKMYAELSDETAQIFDFMLENELFDVLNRPNKEVIIYMDYIAKFKAPFVFSSFNGTAEDIDMLNHEFGHAYAMFVNQDTYPHQLLTWPEDVCEIHGMAMEFLTWPWMKGFFGDDTNKYYRSHMEKTVGLLTRAAMADEFQHVIYTQPDMTPNERNALWLSLHDKYRPWFDAAGIPYWAQGRNWHSDDHIFQVPFLYVDYILAGVVALQIWALSQTDFRAAWVKYNEIIKHGGTKPFEQLVESCDQLNPFEPENLQQVAATVLDWLDTKGAIK